MSDRVQVKAAGNFFQPVLTATGRVEGNGHQVLILGLEARWLALPLG